MKHLFVISSENDLRIGKLVDCFGYQAKSECFQSPADAEPICKEVSFTSLKKVTLCNQTRVYFGDQSGWVLSEFVSFLAKGRFFLRTFLLYFAKKLESKVNSSDGNFLQKLDPEKETL